MPTLTDAQRETFRRDMEAMIEQVRRLSETSRFASEQATSFADTVRGIVRIIKPVTKALRWLHRRPRHYPPGARGDGIGSSGNDGSNT